MEASRHRPASLPALKKVAADACLASQAKIYAITRHTDAPRVAWCLNNADKRRQEVFFFYPRFDLFCGLVLIISKDGKNNVKVLCASLPQKKNIY